jgi:predicted Zn-dependent protease
MKALTFVALEALTFVALAALNLQVHAPAQTQPGTAADELQLGMEPYKAASRGTASSADTIVYREEASKHFQRALDLDPRMPEARQYLGTNLLMLGASYVEQNRLPEAEQTLKRAIEVDPVSFEPRLFLAKALMLEGKSDEVESLARRTKKDLPNNPYAYNMLGNFYLRDRFDLDKAEAEYASVHRDHPKDVDIKKNYIQVLILKNHFDEAAKLNNEILRANHNDRIALLYKGELQLRHNDADGAVDSLQSALHNYPDTNDLDYDKHNTLIHYFLGVAFCQKNDEASAQAEWREVLRLSPDTFMTKDELTCKVQNAKSPTSQ